MGCSKSRSKSWFIAQIKNKFSSKQPNITLHLEEPDKEQVKARIRRMEEIIKIRAEINEIENRKTIKIIFKN